MGKRVITMLEVSQKQAYIFSSNKLKDNVTNSAVIAWIMSPEYFEEVVADKSLFSKEENLVYSGGGHTILEFPDKEQAVAVCKMITTRIRQDYQGIEVFAKTIPYEEKDKDGKELTPSDNLKNLTAALEKKKSIRRAGFHQGSFGVEQIDTNTLCPVVAGKKAENEMPEQEKEIDEKLSPEKYDNVSLFEDLGGDNNRSNFIAVVHIDGNAMGKRIEELNKNKKVSEWNDYKKMMKDFSDSIDQNFKDAYKEMVEMVARNLDAGKLNELKLKKRNFPIRRIITAGDDICFVTEGRIGIECAVAFIKALGKQKNAVDEKSYSACAGVAIVHQKYPFYRAYELAELLCSNAKKFGASYTEDGLGKDVSSIDWHIEYGEMRDSLEDIRKKYETQDGRRLELRPYIVSATDEINEKEKIRQYSNFKKLITKIKDKDIAYARGKIKELRSMLKQGEHASRHYIKFYKLEDLLLESYYGIFKETDISKTGTGQALEKPIFISTSDKEVERSYLFDVIEMMDTYIALEY